MAARCYLDWNATAPVRDAVVAAVAAVLRSDLGNPSSVHAEGRRARRLLDDSRQSVAGLLGCDPDEVVFTSGGTEANAMAIWGLLAAGGSLAGRPLLVSAVEHPSVAAMALEMARLGVVVVRVPVTRTGVLDLSALEDGVRAHPSAVVAVQLANSETGVRQDLAEVSRIAHAAGASVHCDAIQAVGKVAVRAEALGVDTLAMSGHKLGAPAGVGVLVARAGRDLAPLVPGAQERHRRGGTENLSGIAGLAAAADLAPAELPAWEAAGAVRDLFETALRERVSDSVVYGSGAARLPNTSCVGLPDGLHGGTVAAALDLEGFAVSSGPACSSGVERGSPTVEAMGFGAAAAERTLRVSLGPGTGPEQATGLAAALERIGRRRKGDAR